MLVVLDGESANAVSSAQEGVDLGFALLFVPLAILLQSISQRLHLSLPNNVASITTRIEKGEAHICFFRVAC